MAEATTERLCYDGVYYLLRIPKDAQSRASELRILVSIHGSNGDAADYLKIVTESNDDDRYSLVVVAPQFPKSGDAPNSSMHGENFDSYESPSHRWLHALIHDQLPQILAKRKLTVCTDKVHLFGHSRGGQFIHTYMLRYHSKDVLRAAICGPGLLRRRSHDSFVNMPTDEYRNRLVAFVQADVAIIIGTSDCANSQCLTDPKNNGWDPQPVCGKTTGREEGNYKWKRIRHVMGYFDAELAPLLGEAYMKCIIEQHPPDWHPDGAFFPIPSGPATDPVCNKRIRFHWTANPSDSDGNPIQGHRGDLNYPTARRHLFESIPMLCPATEVERYGWTSGWTTAEFYTVGNATFLFLLKAGDGTVHIHRMHADGTVGAKVQERAWSSGWTAAEFYTVGGATFLFLLKAGDGTVHIHRMNADGTVGARVVTEIQEHDWSCGWTTAEFYTVGDATFLFLLSRSNGTVHIHKMPRTRMQ